MYEIRTLDDVRGNNVAVYSIRTLLERKCFPKLSIMAGVMGVGKTSIARVVAGMLDDSGIAVKTYNFGLDVDMQKLQEEVFSLNPMRPRAFIFEEIHGLARSDQNALLQMFDSQSRNVYVICTTTELHKVLRTIRSRAQVWEFKLLSEKQLAQLLDDYLKMKNATLSDASKQSLLRACRGVPRDLLKSADFALDGEFTHTQLDALLGNVSDEVMFSVFCSLKSTPVDFIVNLEALMEEVSAAKLQAMNDLRFLMERSGGMRKTLTTSMVKTLNSIYTLKEMSTIAKMLLRATPDTLMLELVSLNMSLTGSTAATSLGQQKDIALKAESEVRGDKQKVKGTQEGARLTGERIREIVL